MKTRGKIEWRLGKPKWFTIEHQVTTDALDYWDTLATILLEEKDKIEVVIKKYTVDVQVYSKAVFSLDEVIEYRPEGIINHLPGLKED